MQYPADLFAEKNYTGSRLIEIDDPKVKDLRAKAQKLQEEANVILEGGISKMWNELDPYNKQIQELENKKNEIREKMQKLQEPFQEDLKKLQALDQKAANIKNKITPLVQKIVESGLGEFETAHKITEKDGKTYVEVIDEIEEKVKAIRAVKAQKKDK